MKILLVILMEELKPYRIKRYALQIFRSEQTLSSELSGLPAYPRGYIEALAAKMADKVDDIQLRM